MTKRPLLVCACVFLLGTYFASEHAPLALAAMFCCIICLLIDLGRHDRLRYALLWIGLLSAVFAAADVHAQSVGSKNERVLSQISDGTIVSVQGEILSKQKKEEKVTMQLTDCLVQIDGEVLPCGDILLPISYDAGGIGSTLTAEGKVNLFSEARNEGSFDMRSYYQSLGILFELEDAQIGSVYKKCGFREQLYRLRQKLSDSLSAVTDERTAGVLSDMLLGEKSGLDADVKSLFLDAGISHILAISGLHISLFAAGLYRLLRRAGLSFGPSAVISGIFVVCYAVLTGASVSTVRAAGMFLLSLAAPLFRRSYDALNALGPMVTVLLWQNPNLIFYSGFWFSVTAILGVHVAASVLSLEEREKQRQKKTSAARIKKWWNSRRQKLIRSLRRSLICGIAVQAATLPLVAYGNFEVPTYALLLNLLVLPALSVVLLSGAAGMAAGCFFIPLGRVLIFPARVVLLWYQKLCEGSLLLPHASQITGQPRIWELFLYYGLFAAVLLFRWYAFIGKERKHSLTASADSGETPKISKKSKGGCTAACAVVIVLAVVFCRCRTPGIEVDFLDVGQGDGIFVSDGGGCFCFIDGGSSSSSSVGTYRILPFLKAKGADHIDCWFVSHADMDHISGILEVLSAGYRVDRLIVSYAAPDDEQMRELYAAAEEAGAAVWTLAAGDVVTTKEADFCCLYPFGGLSEEEINAPGVDRNDRSLVLSLQLSDLLFLFTGDISSDQEEEMLAAGTNLSADVYKVSHHGSRYASGSDFLQAADPAIAVISCAEHNRYGHPASETIERLTDAGCRIYQTMQSGEITIYKKKGEWRIKTFLP